MSPQNLSLVSLNCFLVFMCFIFSFLLSLPFYSPIERNRNGSGDCITLSRKSNNFVFLHLFRSRERREGKKKAGSRLHYFRCSLFLFASLFFIHSPCEQIIRHEGNRA